jgi:hypothetical protein
VTDDELRTLMPHVLTRLDALESRLSDHDQRFDTLQTPLWKRIWFRIDGWPGQRDLNADRRAWRPWH